MDSTSEAKVLTEDMMEEKLQLTLNYRGQDVDVIVDINTANILLNNPLAADQFLSKWFEENPTSAQTEDHTDLKNEHKQNMTEESEDESGLIWKKKKPDRLDHAATELFLSLREKYQHQFDDKKTQKSQLWKKIAKEMEEAGYKLGDNGSEKCRQKFANLQKQYLNHVKHVKVRTGTEHKDPPPYFNEMHNLLCMKDKVAPQNLQDSERLPPESDDSSVDDVSDAPKPAEPVKNRFASVKRSLRPVSTNSQLIALLEKQHEEDKAARENLLTLIAQQNTQRDKMIELMSQLVKNSTQTNQNQTTQQE